MRGDAAHPPRELPTAGEPFKPWEVFRGIGVFIPEKAAASTVLSMTAKVCYGHLCRRAGKNNRCWPSHRDIAKSIGVGERQAVRALKELAEANLIRPIPRVDPTGRQTSNEYEFIWGPILQGEGDRSDTLPHAKSDRGRVTDPIPTGVSGMTPLEVSKRNHHQGSTQKGSIARAKSRLRSCWESEATSPLPSLNLRSDDDDSNPTKYAAAKDELKAIVSKAGQPLRVSDLDSIEALLAGAGVTWDAFVAEARRHSWSRVTNPIGFLKSLAKSFRAKTQLASAPLTAAEAEERDYQCPKCFSRIRGEGVRLEGTKTVPCECASPEYVRKMIERKVMAAPEIDPHGETGTMPPEGAA
jgi:hypothetical protein